MRIAALALALPGCACGFGSDDMDTAIEMYGERAASLDSLFHQQPRWLGGDGAYTIDLGDARTLWLFGDSFIATSPLNIRSEAKLVRNSVAVMTGHDLETATMDFAWREAAAPSSFFAEDGDQWFWPSDGVRVPGGPLVVFLSAQVATPNQGLGFASAGFRAVRIADPSGPADSWTITMTAAHAPAYAPDANVACSTVVDDHLVALVTDGNEHHGRMARWTLTDVSGGNLAFPEWWSGSQWIPEPALTEPPAIVIDDGATECSLAYDPYAHGYVHIASRGFGATTIAARTATAITGPYTDPTDVFSPPESATPNAFVYAAKAHPLLASMGALVVTYADNSFTFGDLVDPALAATLYWPHVMLLYITESIC